MRLLTEMNVEGLTRANRSCRRAFSKSAGLYACASSSDAGLIMVNLNAGIELRLKADSR